MSAADAIGAAALNKGASFFHLSEATGLKDSFLAVCLKQGEGNIDEIVLSSEYPTPNELDPAWNVKLYHKSWTTTSQYSGGGVANSFPIHMAFLQCGFLYADKAARKPGSIICKNMSGIFNGMADFLDEAVWHAMREMDDALALFEHNCSEKVLYIVVGKENVCFLGLDLEDIITEDDQFGLVGTIKLVSVRRRHAKAVMRKMYIGWNFCPMDTFTILQSLIRLDGTSTYVNDSLSERRLAFCMGLHARVGMGSLVALLSCEMVREILLLLFEQEYLNGENLVKFINNKA